jgi:RimJ/RimL family protein N-acetyltransferase
VPRDEHSRERFERLFRLHYPAVRRYARRRVPPEAVDDIVSETFLVAWRRLDQVPEEPLPWLLAVARNTAGTERRAAARRLRLWIKAQGARLEESGVSEPARSLSWMEPGDWLAIDQLETERLILEPLAPEHAEELAPVLDDVSLHRFTGGRPASAKELRARFERQIVGHSPDGCDRWLNWTVRLRATGQAVGAVQATVGHREARTVAEIAWVVGSPFQRQGFAKEAAAAIVAWLRGHGVSSVVAHIHPHHDASMAVARSVGLAPNDVIKDGELRWEST